MQGFNHFCDSYRDKYANSLGMGTSSTTLAMAFKLIKEAEQVASSRTASW